MYTCLNRCSLLMDGLVRAGLPAKALDTFSAMKSAAIAPNLQTYTTAITAVSCADL